MGHQVFSAPEGTVREFLTNLGIADEDAVSAIRVNSSLGTIEVDMVLRGPDGKFLTASERTTRLPEIIVHTLHFVEDAPEPIKNVPSPSSEWDGGYTVTAYNTAAALESLNEMTDDNAHNYTLVSDEGVRGKLRTFTFKPRLAETVDDREYETDTFGVPTGFFR